MKTNLTDKQFKLARAFERAGLCTISQAVKAFERQDDVQIELWKKQLAKWQKKRDAEIAEASPVSALDAATSTWSALTVSRAQCVSLMRFTRCSAASAGSTASGRYGSDGTGLGTI